MKIFCKKFCVLFFLNIVLFFAGCAEDDSTEYTLYPDNTNLYFRKLFPNDQAQNDSAAAYLAHGITLIVHPQATYQLSFDVDPNFEAPTLQLFRLVLSEDQTEWYPYKVRSIEPTIDHGRYVYSFMCEENAQTDWATSLELDETY